MKIHAIQPPGGLYYTCGTNTDPLDSYDMEYFGSTIEEVWYWYTQGHYEGNGALIARNYENKFIAHDMGHCSCYGPTDRFNASEAKSLAEIRAELSDYQRPEFDQILQEVEKIYPSTT